MKSYLSKEKLTSGTTIIIYLMVLNFIIHMVTGWAYGIFRDEFYYVSMSNHLDFGYVDITPIAVYIMALSRFLFGTSIYAMHVFPAIAGSFVILFGALIARKMGGGRFAQVLTAIAIMAASMYISFAGFFSYDVFDQLISAIVIYVLSKILKDEGTYKTWILLGFMAGIGIMVKITMGVFLVSLVFGLLMTRARKHLANKWLWIAGAIALACFVPYAVWQAQRDFPFLQYLGNYTQNRSTHATPLELFGYELLVMNPVSVVLWLGGLVLLFTKKGRTFRPFAWAFIFYFTVAVLLAIKYYALAGVFLPLLANGAVWFERGYRRIRQPEEEGVQRPEDKNFWAVPRIILVSMIVVTALFVYPTNTPVLPVNDFIAYNNITGFGSSVKSEDTKLATLPQHFADRFSWEELAQAVSDTYHSLPESEQKDCRIFCSNYGEAGAIDYYSEKYNLPGAISGHLSYYYWGYDGYNGKCLIIVGYHADAYDYLKKYFGQVTIAQTFHADYIMPYENDNPIFICKNLISLLTRCGRRCRALDDA